jgi:tetratricopeptide (TPR) repeat protein
VRDLDEFGTRVVQLPLERLSADAGVELMRARGVLGPERELRRAVDEYRGHALALNLLAGYLADVHEGDVTRRSEVPPGDLVDDGAERVLRAYDEWYAGRPPGAALRLLGFFDRPATAGALRALMRGPVIPGLTEPLQGLPPAEWARTLAQLRRASLVTPPDPDAPGEVDTHPLVRAYYERQVRTEQPEAWRQANDRLYEHYRDEAAPLPDTLDDMQPLLLALVHGCRAGRHRDALHEVYVPRVMRGAEGFIIRRLGATNALLTALAGFFEPGDWSRPVEPDPPLRQGLTPDDQLMVLPTITQALFISGGYASPEMQACAERVQTLCILLGRPGPLHAVLRVRWRSSLVTHRLSETMQRARQVHAFAVEQTDPAIHAHAQGLLAVTCMLSGQLYQAAAHVAAGVAAWNSGAQPQVASDLHMPLVINLMTGGMTSWHLGRPRESADQLAAAVQAAGRDVEPMAMITALYGMAFVGQFKRDAVHTLASASRLVDVAGGQGNRLYLSVGMALRGWALVRMGDAGEGIAAIQQGIARLRQMQVILHLGYFYSLLADAQLFAGRVDEARQSLGQARRAAARVEEIWWSAETLRLEGVIQRREGDGYAAGETFRQAMELARSYGSRALEARAAASLVRLLREQGAHAAADGVRRSVRGSRAPAAAAVS